MVECAANKKKPRHWVGKGLKNRKQAPIRFKMVEGSLILSLLRPIRAVKLLAVIELWTFTSFSICKLKLPNLVNFSEIYLAIICNSQSLFLNFDVTILGQAFFSEFVKCPVFF